MNGFSAKRAIVSVVHCLRIQAHHFTTVADNIHAIVFDRCRRRNAAVRPIEVRVLLTFRHHKLPKQAAAALLKTHQHAAVPTMFRITRLAVVRPDVNASASNNGRRMSLCPKSCRPSHVLASGRIERTGQIPFARDHVARPGRAPLRLIGCQCAPKPKTQKGNIDHCFRQHHEVIM